ncbi:hypothetical protein ACJX0J_039132, partial [Zea mays]
KVQVLLIHFFQMNINTPGNAIEKIVHFPALVLMKRRCILTQNVKPYALCIIH